MTRPPGWQAPRFEPGAGTYRATRRGLSRETTMSTVGEGIVAAIQWHVVDPHAEMPESLQRMTPAERKRMIASVERMVDKHGPDGAMRIAAGILDHMRRATS